MTQHNPDTKARYCYQPRDQLRTKARRAIRKRVDEGILQPIQDVLDTEQNVDEVITVLEKIIQNDRSFFSLQNLDKSRTLLSSLIPLRFVWEGDGETLRGQEKLVSWYGFEDTDRLKKYLADLESIAFYDYATIFQRYHVVSCFLLGGINPCLRGHFRGDDEIDMEWQERLVDVGASALKQFFDGVPLTLSSYIVKRSFDLRFHHWKSGMHQDTCELCARTELPRSVRLCFSCSHVVCESCYWETSLYRLDYVDGDSDVVACPCCHPAPSTKIDNAVDGPIDPNVRRQRREETCSKYYSLPKDGNDLKQLGKKGKAKLKIKNGRFILCSTWSNAVKPFLGNSQETRLDRFLNAVENGSLRRVQGCLDTGIDLNIRNQYGQSALYTAAWRGHEPVVRILLENGADPNLTANGDSTAADAAATNSFHNVVKMLELYGGKRSICMRDPLSLPCERLSVCELIPRSREHPGAGSYTIDGILGDESIRRLVQLWDSLPIAEGRIKAGSCSERRYFCDVGRFVTSLLVEAMRSINDSFDGILFLPFMRFLCYYETGTVLAPHVDLCRDDYDSGKKSTHTFLLYLSDCRQGGATTLLESLSGEGRRQKVAVVRPQRGRLLLFPHACPHEGESVIDVPKLLIRGEAIVPEAFQFV